MSDMKVGEVSGSVYVYVRLMLIPCYIMYECPFFPLLGAAYPLQGNLKAHVKQTSEILYLSSILYYYNLLSKSRFKLTTKVACIG